MSNTVDERVVKMQFDNASFEKNVQTSLGTLAKLKEALHFDKVDMSGIASNIEKITDKVTGMGGVWDNICQRMINMAVDTGQKIAKAFVFDPPSDGFKEYELKMNSLKVIMESSHESLETVNKYLNDLNAYSDQTIYSFSDMTNNIGKFTNAGVSLDASVAAIKGVANAAALAGSNTQQASHAMYNFAQALSSGSVKRQDWMSIETASMGTKDFKEALIDTAVALGTVKKTEDGYISTTTNLQGKVSDAFSATSNWNDSLAHQWLTTDVLTNTLRAYSTDVTKMTEVEKAAYEEELKGLNYTDEQIKKLEDLGTRATKAATEVRTFSAMMDALKEAVGSGWAQTWEIIFGNMEEATEFWTSINDVLSGFIDKFSDSRNTILQGWKDLGGRTKLLEGLANIFKILGNVIKPVSDALKVLFPPMTAERLADLTNKFANFTEKIKNATDNFPMKLFDSKETNAVTKGLDTASERAEKFASKVVKGSDTIKKAWKGSADGANDATETTISDFEKIREAAKQVILGDPYGTGQERIDQLKAAGLDPDAVQAYVDKIHELSNGSWDLSDEMFDAAAKSLGLTETVSKQVGETVKETTEEAKESINDYEVEVAEITKNGNILTSILVNIGASVKAAFGSGLKIIGTFGKAWRDSFSPVKITIGQLQKFDESLKELSKSFSISDETLSKIQTAFTDFFTVVKTGADLIISFGIKVIPPVISAIKSLASIVGGLALGLFSFVSGAVSSIVQSDIFKNIIEGVTNAVATLAGYIDTLAKVFGYFGDKIESGIKYMADYIKQQELLSNIAKGLTGLFTKIGEAVTSFGGKLGEALGFKTFDEFKTKLDSVIDRLSKDFLIPGFKRLVDFINDLVTGTASLDKVTKLFGDFGKGVRDFFSGLFSKDANSPSIFDRLGKFISGSFSGKFTGFVNLLKNAGPVIKSFFDGLFGKKSALEGVAKGASSTLAPGLKKLSDEADSYVQGIGRLQNAINTVYGGLNKTFNSENIGKHVGEFAGSLQKADADIPKTLPEKLKAIFESFKTDFAGPAIEKASEAFGKLKAFVANVDYKKLLLAAKALRTVQQTLSGIKLANSFSGMAKNIGGFFKSLSEDGLKINAIPEESKFSKMVKVAIAIALVAKAMSMIAAIPEDRLASSVGVVAGITAVMTGIIIAFEKIKSAEGSDLSGAAKTMIAMSAAVYILAKAMEMLGDQDPASLIAGGAAISALVFVLTKAAKSLKDAKLNPGDAMAPVGFAIALKILTGVVLSFAKTPPADLLQGIIITTLMLQLLKGAVKQLNGAKINAAAVAAPLAFAVALGLLLAETVAYSLVPTLMLTKGQVAIFITLSILRGAVQSLNGLQLSPATVLAPIAFAVALGLLVGTILILGMYPIEKMNKAFTAIIGLSLIVAGFMLIQSFIAKYVGGSVGAADVMSLIAFAAAIDLLAVAVSVLSFIPPEKLNSALNVIVWLGIVIMGLMATMALASNYSSVGISNVMGLIAAVGSILVLSATVALLGMIPRNNLIKGVAAVAAIGLVLAGMEYVLVKASKEMNISAANVLALVGIVVAIQMLGVTAALLGMIPRNNLIKGIAAVTALGLVLAAMEYVLVKASKEMNVSAANIFALMGAVVAIRMLALTAVLVGVINPTVLAKGVIVLGVLSAFLLALGYVFGKMTFTVADILAPIAIVGAVMILVAAVAMLGSMDSGQMAQGTFGVVALLVGLSIALTALCGMAGPIAVLAASFLMFAGGVALFGAAALMLATGISLIANALVALSEADPMRLVAGLSVLGMSLVIFGAMLVGVVAALMMFPAAIVVLLAFGAAILMVGQGLYLISQAIQTFVNVSGQVASAVSALAEYVSENLDEFLEGIKNAVLGGLKYLAKNVGPFLAKGGELIASAAKGIAKNAPKVLSSVRSALSKAVAQIAANLPQWLSKGAELIGKLASGIAKKAPDVVSKVKNLLSKAKSAITQKYGEFVSAGKNMISGLISGVAAKAGELADKARSVVSGAISAAKNALQINSPSKVFRSMGYSIDEGLIVGMTKMADKVSEASEFVTTGIIDAAKGPLDYLADLLSGDIIDDPTITPVLDLSEIQNGANRLYSMLPDSERLSLNGNVDLASMTSRSVDLDRRRKAESDNQMMGRLIDAIDGLSALIGNTGNTYNVNGVTYDDGSNISSAVRTLVRAAVVEGRA